MSELSPEAMAHLRRFLLLAGIQIESGTVELHFSAREVQKVGVFTVHRPRKALDSDDRRAHTD